MTKQSRGDASLLQELILTIERHRVSREVLGADRRQDYLSEIAASMLHARHLRDHIFNARELFGEPAWNILLDLTVAASTTRKLSITDVCLASGVPQSTALRYIDALEHARLVEREQDSTDKRRYYLKLTVRGLSKMRQFARALIDEGTRIPLIAERPENS